MAQPKGLGKGLSALMSDVVEAPVAAVKESKNTLKIHLLKAGKYQPRRQFSDENLHELADSIERNGMVQPIVVRPLKAGNYEIIAGERRWRAAKLAKIQEVPVIIRELSDAQALEIGLIENIQRQDLNPLEEAQAYQRLMKEFNYTQEKLADSVAKSRSHIANLLRLLTLPESIKQHIDSGALSMGHARALIGAKDAASLADRIIAEGLNVRQTELLAKGEPLPELTGETPAARAGGGEAKHSDRAPRQSSSDDVRQIEEMLSNNLGLVVSITERGKQKGEVAIRYESLTQLDEILRRLGGSI